MRCFHAREQRLGGAVSDGDGDGDGHAALAGGTVGCAGERVGRLVHVGVGHDDHVVLRPAQGLHPLAGLRAAAIDVLRDGRGADKADRLNAGMVEDARRPPACRRGRR